MPIGSGIVYNTGDLILSQVSSSGTAFLETKIAAATSSIVYFDGNGRINSASLNSITVGTASYASGSTSIITNLTASNISASGYISASNLRVETSVVDGGSLTVNGNSSIGNSLSNTHKVTGSLTITGSSTLYGNSSIVGTLSMNNYNIDGINGLIIADPGPGEGLTWAGGNGWSIYESPNDLTSNTAGNLQFISGSGGANVRRLTLNTDGNSVFPTGSVGIGTDNPAYLLDVSGNIAISQNNAFYRSAKVDGTSIQMLGILSTDVAAVGPTNAAVGTGPALVTMNSAASVQTVYFYTNNSIRMTLNSNGKVGIGTTVPSSMLEVSSSNSSSLLNIKGSGGNGLLYVSGSGNVGIGTTNPQFLLDVSGSSRFGWSSSNTHQFTGSVSLTDGLFATNITASNISASGVITSSGLYIMNPSLGIIGSADAAFDLLKTGVNTLNFALDGTAIIIGSGSGYTLIQNTLIASTLSSSANIIGSNITASNISASGIITSSGINISNLYTNNIYKKTTGSAITINAGNDAAKGLRVYYDMDVYNTINFTDSSYNAQSSIYGTSGTMVFRVNGNATTAMTVTNAGDVGIGTSSPRGGLHINTVNGSDANEYAGLVVSPTISSSRGVNISYDATNDVGTITAVNNGVAWKDLILQPVGGYVGIKTKSPVSLLDVRGGYITSGDKVSVQASKILAGYYNNGALVTLGGEYSNGGPVLGYGVWPSASAGTFISSTGIDVPRGAYTIRGNVHYWYSSTGSSTVAINSPVALNSVASLDATGNFTVNAVTSSLFGTSSWARNVVTASYLVPTNSYTITNLTASNISASGIIIGGITYNESIQIDQFDYFQLQPYIEVGNFPNNVFQKIGGTAPTFTTMTGSACPFGKIAYNTSYYEAISDFIPVNPGETLYGEIWAYRSSGSTGTAGVLYCGIARYDKDKNQIDANAGLTYFIASNATVPTTSTWTKYSGTTTLPLTHTSYAGSDGGPVRYIRPYVIVNYTNGTIPTYWGAFKIRKTQLTRDTGIVTISGSVGIGTTSPSTNLHIYSTSTATDAIIEANSEPRLQLNTNDGLANFHLFNSYGNIGLINYHGLGGGNYFIYNNSGGGTPANSYTYFQTAGTERMRITGAGNVGIGTSIPSSSLHIRNASSGDQTLLILEHSAGYSVGTENRLDFYDDEAHKIAARIAQYYTGEAGNRWGLKFYTNSSTAINSTPTLTLMGNNNVGIGTTNPGSRLEVQFATNPATDNGAGNNVLRVWTSASFAADVGGAIGLGGTYNTSSYQSFGQIAGRKSTAASSSNAGYLQFATTNTAGTMNEWMRIDAGGNVGIGTNNPGAKLEISGSSNSALLNIKSPISGAILYVSGSGAVGIGDSNVGTYRLYVSGSFGATTKSFIINHPTKEGKKLIYGSLESPYHGIRLTGRDTLVNGKCKIQLPEYMYKLILHDSVNIQLTGIKCNKTLYVDDINIPENYFTIAYDKTMFESYKDYDFFWDFTAIRADVPELITEL